MGGWHPCRQLFGGKKGRCEQGPCAVTLLLAEEMHRQQLEAYTRGALAQVGIEQYHVLCPPKMG